MWSTENSFFNGIITANPSDVLTDKFLLVYVHVLGTLLEQRGEISPLRILIFRSNETVFQILTYKLWKQNTEKKLLYFLFINNNLSILILIKQKL